MDNPVVPNESSGHCLNCGTALSGPYCGKCGQEAKELKKPFFRLSREAIHSLFELDGRAFRTLYNLLTKPAYLSQEYFGGRRTRYTPPLRLFLVISVSFFLLVSFYTSVQSLEGILRGENSPASQQTSIDEETAFSSESDVDEPEDNDDGLADILALVDQINLPFFTEQTNANLREAMSAQAESNLNELLEDPIGFASGYLEYITFFILMMIPLLALLQKIIYIRSGHFYVEHLVLTLHNHAFIILVVFIGSLADFVAESQLVVANTLFDYLGTAVYFWMWIYLFLSLKNYFQQGYGITLLKYFTTTVLYGLTLSTGIFFFAAIMFFLF
jgi:Protein of unknown function (DUF3667)